jgi:hypothetical protein
MKDIAATTADNTYSYYQMYQALFETADMTSMFWQPLLKAVGRSQLEMASLQARQARAVMQWSQQILQPASPLDLINAHAQLWQTITEQYVDVVPRVAAAVTTVTQPVGSTVLPMPAKRPRDTLVLIDRQEKSKNGLERKVA